MYQSSKFVRKIRYTYVDTYPASVTSIIPDYERRKSDCGGRVLSGGGDEDRRGTVQGREEAWEGTNCRIGYRTE